MKKAIFLLAVAALFSACSSWQLTRAGRDADRMAYDKAAARLEKVLRRASDPKRATALRSAMLMAADAHQRQHEMKDAAAWYGRAGTLGTLEPEQAFQYGEVLMALNDRPAAVTQFMNVLAVEPEHQAAQDLLASCEAYDLFYADTTHFIVSELPMTGVSSAFGAVPYKDGIVFAGEQSAMLQRTNPWNGRSFLDLYFARKHTAVTWDPAEPLPGEVNGVYHEGPATFSADGRTMYFTRSNYYKFKLQKDATAVSHLMLFRTLLNSDGKWSDVRAFGFNGDDFSTGHAALSSDGNTLYFASDRPGSIGGSDLWRCVNIGAGWGQPENLGPAINTAGDELFPTVVGEALYFSSTAHNNMGGLDIFFTNRAGDDWAPPVNMGYPINTQADDFAFVMNADGKSGYISSDRNGTDRVHQFFVQEPLFYVEGFVFDENTTAYLPNVEVTLTDLATEEDTSMITGVDGRFRFKMVPNSNYRLQAERPGTITETRDISTQGLATASTLHEEFRLQPVNLGRAMVVEKIFFDYDTWDIRPDAAQELNKLARTINDNPGLVFELSAHTDSRGGDLYNLVLSDARANSSVDYLIRSGVAPEQLESTGYGERRLTNSCNDELSCSEEEHQANRRVEVKVIKMRALASQHR